MTNQEINMTLERSELIHKYPGYHLGEFFSDVDKTGGWPNGFKYVAFYHAVKNEDRYCMFTTTYLSNGWWTTICSSDEYYWWKLSDKKKEEVTKTARKQLINQLR